MALLQVDIEDIRNRMAPPASRHRNTSLSRKYPPLAYQGHLW